jgi:hypothetical protein
MIVYHIKAVQSSGIEYPDTMIVLETLCKAEEIEDFLKYYPNQTFKVTTLMNEEEFEKLRLEKLRKDRILQFSVPWDKLQRV